MHLSSKGRLVPAKKKTKKSTAGKTAPRSSKPATKKKIKKTAAKGTATPPAKASARSRSSKMPATATVSESGRPASPPARGAAAATPSPAEKFAIEAARCMDDDKCTEVTVLDVRGKNPMTDYLVIGSGTSDRQMRAVLHHIQDLGDSLGYQAVRSTSDERATWLLADFMNVIVHLFEPNTRAHYDIEMMWGDAPRIPWERPGSPARDRAGLNAVEA